jgi:hypothetical protein
MQQRRTKKQPCCCLLDCDRSVTNRLRFSLRLNHWFKREFLERRWDKVCEYHYFNDRYMHKKSVDDTTSRMLIPDKKKSVKKRQTEPTLKKSRPRKQPKRDIKRRRLTEKMIQLDEELAQEDTGQEEIVEEPTYEEENAEDTQQDEEEDYDQEEEILLEEEEEEILLEEEEEEFMENSSDGSDVVISSIAYQETTPEGDEILCVEEVVVEHDEQDDETEDAEVGIDFFFGGAHLAIQQSNELAHHIQFIETCNVAQSPISRLDHNPFSGFEKYQQLQRMVERLTVYRPVNQHQPQQCDFISQHFVPQHEFGNELL